MREMQQLNAICCLCVQWGQSAQRKEVPEKQSLPSLSRNYQTEVRVGSFLSY